MRQVEKASLTLPQVGKETGSPGTGLDNLVGDIVLVKKVLKIPRHFDFTTRGINRLDTYQVSQNILNCQVIAFLSIVF